MPVKYLTPAVEDRAVEVQLLWTDRGQHRAPSIPDLLVAAATEISGPRSPVPGQRLWTHSADHRATDRAPAPDHV